MSPTIGDRMVRSLLERSISSDVDSVKSTFSSWDNCMAKTYCKWPVIAGIIVGSIIVLGILGCLVSCLCCGYQCCKGCCGCCYNCCSCGGSRHNNQGGSKYADPPQPYYQQPPPPEPMNFGYRQPTAAPAPISAAAPPAYRGPVTATFDQPTKAHANEDELPPMPTWADAQTRRVEDHNVQHEEVEMDNLEGIRDHAKSPMHRDGVSPTPLAGTLSRGMSRGGYNEVPGTYQSPHPTPRPMYDEGHSPNVYGGGYGEGHSPNGYGGGYGEGHPPNGYVGGYGGGHGEQHDPYYNQADQGNYGSSADTHYFNQQPHSPGTPAPAYGTAPGGYMPRASPRASPAPYRGFDNQPAAPRVQVPNFSGPSAYNQAPSPRSPSAMGTGYSPYEQTHSPPPAGPMPSAMGNGYSPYDHQSEYGHPATHTPPPFQPAQAQGQYRAFSPRITSPAPQHQPTSFLEEPDHQSPSSEDRPPTLLMAGRRPAPNSFRAV